MGMIMIRCPATGREVSTGIEDADVEELPTRESHDVCPVCGRVHEWTKDDAWLAEGGQQYRAARR